MIVPARSPVDDALDRLEKAGLELWPPLKREWLETVATVRSELERLREERDAARADHQTYIGYYEEQGEELAAAEAELERQRRHPDAWSQEAFDQQKARAEAAEAEVRRLTEGLRETADELASRRGMIDRAVAAEKFRALLSASPSDGGGA